MSALIVYLLVFCTTVIIALAFCDTLLGQRRIVSTRLFEIQKMEIAEEAEDELKRPFFERLVKPLFSGLVKAMVSLTPTEMRRNIEKKIAYAGNPWNMTFNSFVTLQVLLLSLFVSLAILITWLARLEGARAFLLITLSAVTGAVFPLNMTQFPGCTAAKADPENAARYPGLAAGERRGRPGFRHVLEKGGGAVDRPVEQGDYEGSRRDAFR